MGPAAMSNPDVQGVFIDDVWEEGGPELEGPGSEYAVRDTGMGPRTWRGCTRTGARRWTPQTPQ